AGLHADATDPTVLCTPVCRSPDFQDPTVVAQVETASTSDYLPPAPRDHTIALNAFFGTGYAMQTEGMVMTMRRIDRAEAMLLSPVYTGEAAAGLIALARQGEFGAADTVVFMHSGGVPGLYARTQAFSHTRTQRRAQTSQYRRQLFGTSGARPSSRSRGTSATSGPSP